MNLTFADFAGLKDLRFQPTPGQIYADNTGELAILDSTTGVYYGLNPVGARIWALLLEAKTVGEIRSVLLQEYEVEAFQVESDLAHLLGDLHGKHLIAVATSPSKSRADSATRATKA